MAAPGVPLVIVTSPLSTNEPPAGDSTGGLVTASTSNAVDGVAADALYAPDFDAMARSENVPGVANVMVVPDSAVDDVLGVDPSVV